MQSGAHQNGGVEREDNLVTENKYQQILNRILHFNGVGFVCLLAKEVGILDTLLKAQVPMTSSEVAASKSLKERYTREILASLVVVELVKASVDEKGDHVYHLEESAKRVLDNGVNLPDISIPMTFMTRYFDIRDCLPVQGPWGIQYSKEFREFSSELSIVQEEKIVEYILKSVPGLTASLERGIQVLEFASGDGLLIGKLATRFPNSNFTASEMNKELVLTLKNTLGHLSNMHFEIYDLSALPKQPKKTFDWLLIKNSIHVLPHPGDTLKGTRAMVARPHGIFTFIDYVGKGDPLKSIGDTNEALSYARSVFWCIPMAAMQAKDSESYGCCWSKDTGVRIAQEAGYEVATFPFTPCQILFVAKPI